MANDLITIVKNACYEIGIAAPSTVVGNTGTTALKLLTMSNREGRDLTDAADWTALTRLHTFTTSSGTEEYALPDDYGRLLRDTEWDRTSYRPILGPLTAQHWQAIKSGTLGTATATRRYRIYRSQSSVDRKFYVDPTPSVTGETLAFEYVSKNWNVDVSGTTTMDKWQADTDLSLLDEDLMTLGLVVRFKRSVGLDYASEADEYASRLGAKKSMDRPSPTLNLAQTPKFRLLSSDQAPDTGIGS